MNLTTDDLRHVLRAMPKDARRLMIERAKAGSIPVFLAGGAIRAVIANEPVSDWDFLGGTAGAVREFITGLKAARSGVPARLHTTRNAVTLLTLGHSVVQGITRWSYTDPVRLLEEFDFTIAQAVIWHDGKAWQSLVSPSFYVDLAGKRLTYTRPDREEDAGGSMLRVLKFLRRGYSISPEDLCAVIARLVRGWQPQTGMPLEPILVSLLRAVDPLARIDGLDFDSGEDDPLLPAPDDAL